MIVVLNVCVIVMMSLVMIVMLNVGVIVMMPLVMIVMLNVGVIVMMSLVMIVMLNVGVIVMMPLVMIVMLNVGVIVMMPLVMIVMLNVGAIVMMPLVMIVMLNVGAIVMMPLVMIVMLNVGVIVMTSLVMIVMLNVGAIVMMPLVMIGSGHHGYDVSTPAQPLQHLCVCLWGTFLWQDWQPCVRRSILDLLPLFLFASSHILLISKKLHPQNMLFLSDLVIDARKGSFLYNETAMGDQADVAAINGPWSSTRFSTHTNPQSLHIIPRLIGPVGKEPPPNTVPAFFFFRRCRARLKL